MEDEASRNVTEILQAAADGGDEAFERVAEVVYEELQRVAAGKMHRHYGKLDGLTMEPDVLVHETLLKLMQRPRGYANRRHFYAFATKVMTRVMLDYQRRRSAEKRGGDQVRVTLSGVAEWAQDMTVVELHRQIEELAELDGRKAEVVRLRAFWGLEMSEIAELMGVSLTTVERDWRFSRDWLATSMGSPRG